jgi:chromosome segregation ATPase
MNNTQIRAFVRQLIAEAKDKKAESKKSVKTEEKAPKSSGKLVDLKKELAALKQYKDELMAAKFAEKTASTEVEFADLAKFAKELDALKEKGIKLETEIDNKIAELETKISEAKNKIKEMMGLVPATTSKKPANKIMSEKKKEEVEEARFPKGTDIGKPGKGFAKVAKAAEKEYGSKEAGQKVAGAVLKNVLKKK